MESNIIDVEPKKSFIEPGITFIEPKILMVEPNFSGLDTKQTAFHVNWSCD
jgi:hypothetical protein